MAGEIPTTLYDPVTSSCIGGKNLSLMKSREEFRLTSGGSKQQMTSVFTLAKHNWQNSSGDGWHMHVNTVKNLFCLHIYFSVSSESLV